MNIKDKTKTENRIKIRSLLDPNQPIAGAIFDLGRAGYLWLQSEDAKNFKKKILKNINPTVDPLLAVSEAGALYYNGLAKQEGFSTVADSPYKKEMEAFRDKALEIEEKLTGSLRQNLKRGWKSFVQNGHPGTIMQREIRNELYKPLLKTMAKRPILDKDISDNIDINLGHASNAMLATSRLFEGRQ